ncbi:MAG TPA: DNA polymerase IV [Methylomusa anaerophila]|uniref:DNA polymerase IV n=1 Tax=Methylomusa anaerophila TaxID=1930071 RepID=A0A348AFM5_9FIRM|nr:DNA polymerase IV [Methylomusa anaerophila]BBB89873.1 DNA polymerase IV [Methylomusa anaerophila]HML89080.1 DNA polymerase IV [Methylomusa anaerophila]
MQRWIIHVDMDAFYAAIEQRDNPSLRSQPVIVGGIGNRGVVSTASYEARKFGVKSAMPMITARRLCPQGIVLSPNHRKYAAISNEIGEILACYSPTIEPLSLDEAFLDVSGMEWLYADVADIAREIKNRIKSQTDLTASAGAAPNKFLAKLASDFKKPDGLVIVRPGEELAFLNNIPLRQLWGVGETTAKILRRLGVNNVNQLRQSDPKVLEKHLGKIAQDLINLAWGQGNRPVVSDREARSIGNETTFSLDLHDREDIQLNLLALAVQVGRRLRKSGYVCRTITVKIRYSSFQTITRSSTLAEPTHLDEVVYETALNVFNKVELQEGVRLLGVTASNLLSNTCQMSLFNETNEKREKVSEVVDMLKDRFGSAILTRASLLDK